MKSILTNLLIGLIVAASTSINSSDGQSSPASQLFSAISRNDTLAASLLLAQNSSLANARTFLCCTYMDAPALICAGCQGASGIASLLLKAGADIEGTDDDGGTALIWTARAGYVGIVNQLLDFGANINAYTSLYSDTALTMAAFSNRYDVVQVLVKRGANVNWRQDGGKTARDLASERGYTTIMRYLDSVTGTTPGGSRTTTTPRTIVISLGSLLAGLGDSVSSSQQTSFFRSIASFDNDNVAAMLTRNSSLATAKSPMCCTYRNAPALICAACVGNIEAVRLVATYGANLEGRDADGGTALIWAARNGYITIVRYLIANGADVDAATTNNGDTALTFAAYNGYLNVVQALVEAGADKTAETFAGYTAAELARIRGYNDVATYLSRLV